MKKLLIIFCLALFLSIQSFAIPKDPCDNKITCCDEAPPGPYAFTYPKDVGLTCPRDFYTYGEFLWMKASEEGLDYGVTDTGDSLSVPIVGDIIGFSSKSHEWDWRPGFRVGLGAYINHDSWSVNATWTYIRIKADSSEHVNYPGTTIIPVFLNWSSLVIKGISARWSGDYNTMDVMVGKPYHTSRYYVSHPQFGIRATWIDQDLHIRHHHYNNYNIYHVYWKNDFWGVGLRALYEGEFLLSSSWQLFGKTALSLLFGKFDIDLHSEPLTIAAYWGYSLKDSYYTVVPNAEINLGIKWHKFFHKEQYRLSLKAAYEYHHWWDQNQGKNIFWSGDSVTVVLPQKGDLSFNGFTFGLSLDF